METKRKVGVLLTPLELAGAGDLSHRTVVVMDVLRATSCMCAALYAGASAVEPIGTLEEAKERALRGEFVACERDGARLDFASIGNSPQEYTRERVAGLRIVYSTTNGTRVLNQCAGAGRLLIGGFVNLSALVKYIATSTEGDVLLVCSGWKGEVCLEDAALAGAIVTGLSALGGFEARGDGAYIARLLWEEARVDLRGYARRCHHRVRLEGLGMGQSVGYCFSRDAYPAVGELREGLLLRVE